VVRGTDDDAEVRAELLREHGDRGRRQRSGQQHVDAGRDEAGLERRLEHVAGHARVLADQNGAALRRERARGRAREPQRKIHRHWVGTDPAANTVRAEIALGHASPSHKRHAPITRASLARSRPPWREWFSKSAYFRSGVRNRPRDEAVRKTGAKTRPEIAAQDGTRLRP